MRVEVAAGRTDNRFGSAEYTACQQVLIGMDE